ncbi:Nuclear distribution protein RO10 [Penicillium waksmanii]|uniref:Nuclear distribution protein RO10 n=1 Tax=Penicillium waksmanii TaxID=69791 RepID=UPI0025493C25|nr:Nuclear distribution protein RO10 [Penicillium waksmanii]KAJ5966374.1 Nuclear distribution protein RO10 [Penicillium waksmanii]
MTVESDTVAGATIELLEARLRRLSYLLTGSSDWIGVPNTPSKPTTHDETISRRLARLEKELEKLSKSVPAVRDIIQLQDQNKTLFHPEPTTETIPEGLTPQTLTSIILSYASAFPETSSRLTSLNDLPIPDAQSSAALIELQPALDRAAGKQAEQAAAISELRVRTARVLQRWYEVGLVGSGEAWAEWEGRLEGVEREVRRREVFRERRENEI